MSGIVELNDSVKVQFSSAVAGKPHTRRVHRKNKKGKKGRQLNEVNMQDLERENLLTKVHPRRAKLKLAKRFNPNQPRDHRGRWTDTTGMSLSVVNVPERHRDKGDNTHYYRHDAGQDEDQIEEDEERVHAYSSEGWSNEVSYYLRNGEVDEEDGIFDEDELNEMIGSMDRIIERNILSEDTSLYRVAPASVYNVPDGTEVSDSAYMSTTAFHYVASKYATNDDDVLMRIDMPAGSHILPHRHLAPNASAKGEVILPRGTVLRKVGTENGVAVFVPVFGVGKRWHFNPNQPRDYRGRWTDTGFGMGRTTPNARRLHRDDVSPFPDSQASSTRRRATGARSATPAKKTAAKKTTASVPRQTRTTAAKKTAAAPRRVNNSLYDHSTGTVASRSSIPRINRGGTHIQQHADGRPIVTRPYTDPGEAYYQRNAGPNRITNERLQEIFEDPSKMTLAEKRMIASAGGAKALDGEDKILVNTSRGVRELDRYQVIGQLRSKIAPGSGNSKSGITRGGLSEERRKKMAEKRRESGKPSAAEFGKIEKQITEDWSTDGGKTVVCVFCGKKMSPHGMSVETPKPKALGGNYKDRGGRWPAHNACNTRAGAAAQKDPIAYQEEMMKKFNKLPKDVRERLPHVYDYFPQLGKYPGTAAQRKKYMARGPK
ncbi:hypothetical protein GCM10010423_65320 [Streptomyces levis]|uniref:Uncharacterized protein n=1 Tax=Streptomyces levis TaxID=285566 RepID=A0ABN3P2L7_9ACTN